MAAAVETKPDIQYLTNEAGEKTGVLIPIEMWENMEQILIFTNYIQKQTPNEFQEKDFLEIIMQLFAKNEEVELSLEQQEDLETVENEVRETITEYKSMRESKKPVLTLKEFLDDL